MYIYHYVRFIVCFDIDIYNDNSIFIPIYADDLYIHCVYNYNILLMQADINK